MRLKIFLLLLIVCFSCVCLALSITSTPSTAQSSHAAIAFDHPRLDPASEGN